MQVLIDGQWFHMIAIIRDLQGAAWVVYQMHEKGLGIATIAVAAVEDWKF